jgi:hypothetical protein
VNEIRNGLEAIGLGQYAGGFDANDIDTELLPQIDDQLLKDIGVSSAGHRKPAPHPLPMPVQRAPLRPPRDRRWHATPRVKTVIWDLRG